ncbi:odorant receptor 13a-like isoform X1 [Vespa velutina]|uniref:odorant receptor 13a-like isoform X1 n=1 Tax=Vespa velutina TaxID=202808 RepID=UPI001FB46348|nr:odorant receptor 13a-like isoform X1 [Vespa velutina]
MNVGRVSQVEYACGWNLYTMKFIGIWPEERRFDQISSYKVLIGIAFIILFCTIPQSIVLYFDRDDFDLIMENLSVDNMNGTIAFIKMIFFWSSGGQMKDLLSAMEEDWKDVATKEDERKMMKLAKFSRILATRATAICYALISVYAVKKCLSMRTNGRDLFLSAYFPFETMTSPMFELTFICQIIGLVYYTTAYTAVDTFIAMLILHVCGQLSRLQNNLINLNSDMKNEFQIKLSYIVKRHDYLNRFVDTIEDRFNIMFLFQILGCTLQLCIECFQGLMLMAEKVEQMPLIEIFFFGFYIFYVLLQLYLYCYVGEKLWSEVDKTLMSTELARAAYVCKWYDLLPNEARCLILIIRRARSPLHLTAGKFFTLNHELYSSVLKTSMGYLSVLRATTINDEQ